MPHTLIAVSTVDGHTLKICQRIQQLLERRNHQVTLVSVDDALRMDCRAFDKIVIGASVRYGKHQPSVYAFIAKNRAILDRGACAFFSVSAVARKAGKDTPESNTYFQRFRQTSQWEPPLAATFAGKIDYSKYTLKDRLVIQFIMWLTHGPTDIHQVVEFTRWEAVDEFAERVVAMPCGNPSSNQASATATASGSSKTAS
jgi:menaquinone-dependent protoporphyrinogen oxidase